MRLSYATAVELGLKKGKIDFPNYTAYLMIGEKCLFNCSYCAQARNAQSNTDLLSRIKWPEISVETFKNIFIPTKFKRICIQVVSSLDYWNELNELLSFLEETEIPISVSIRPRNIEEVRTLFKKYNVDRVGMAIDVANKELFSKIRGGRYEFYEKMLINASNDFPNRITTHIIVGLGETDENIIEFLLKMKKFKILVSLFSFTPIKGTKFENLLPPSLSRYRKIQIAREIILKYEVEKADFLFDSKGNLQKLPEVKVDMEETKKTSGCPWCTRPFYNEKPAEELYNVPIPRKIHL
ncbi:radical SAM protein [Petrotoga halophila]|uniref:Radical SAM protein n=1 Tax=Petrotoga halophila DSM 16923 TaxID=1122953 RepID=A0A2S5EHM5_9BACT|nr:radical SAM protein [Petrotoga halophila]POZ92651.1 radical SAM protein [Petrotoga halophila DSM 16923]